MRSGIAIVEMCEKKFGSELPVDIRRCLIFAIELALKEVYELGQQDVVKVGRKLAQQKKEEDKNG